MKPPFSYGFPMLFPPAFPMIYGLVRCEWPGRKIWSPSQDVGGPGAQRRGGLRFWWGFSPIYLKDTLWWNVKIANWKITIEIVDFPIKHDGLNHSYVKLPDGTNCGVVSSNIAGTWSIKIGVWWRRTEHDWITPFDSVGKTHRKLPNSYSSEGWLNHQAVVFEAAMVDLLRA